MGAQSFNYAPNFPKKMRGSRPKIVHFWTKIVPPFHSLLR